MKASTNSTQLCKVYSDYFPIGTAVNSRTIHSHKQLIIQQYNSITAENEMKPESFFSAEREYQFEVADEIVDFAMEHHMKVRGHTLVWHNQTPNWFFEDQSGEALGASKLQNRMANHIQKVVDHFKGKVYCWDVVNEAVSDNENEHLRPSKWLTQLGPDFIADAFRFAHQADPQALLFYNDYNEVQAVKRDKIYRLVEGLLQQQVPIHGIGMQGHWNIQNPTVDEMRDAIELYASLGVQVQITELDVSIYPWDDKRTESKELDDEVNRQLETRYQEVFQLLREYSKVISSVTFWGPADDATWLDHFPVRNRKNYPMLFDVNHQPKPAFWKTVQF